MAFRTARRNEQKVVVLSLIALSVLISLGAGMASAQNLPPDPPWPNPSGFTATSPGGGARCETVRAVLTPDCTGALWDTVRWTGGLRLERGWCNNKTRSGGGSGWGLDMWNNGCIWWRNDDPEGPVTLELTLVGDAGSTQAVWAEYGWNGTVRKLEYQSSVAPIAVTAGSGAPLLNLFALKTDLAADGSDATPLAAVLKDASCALMPNQPVVFSTSKGTLRSGSVLGASVTVTTNSQGYAHCDLIADSTPGWAVVTASALGSSDTVEVAMWTVPTPPEPTAEDSNLGGDQDIPYFGEPVHPGLGNFVWTKELFGFPGKGMPVLLEVAYNSWDHASDGPLGFGWTHTYNAKLTAAGTDVSIKWGDGHTERFQGDISGNFLPVDCNTTVTLTKPDSDHYLATLHSGVTCLFDASGRLLEIDDPNGNQITLTHSTHLDRITDTAGRQINFAYTGGRLSAITSPLKAGNTVAFQYDGDGNLITVTDPRGKPWRFTYDASHRVLTHVDARGNTALTNAYDPATGRITAQTDALGHTTAFSYAVDANGTTTTITPPSGNVVTHTYDVGFSITKVVDGENNAAVFTRGANGAMIKAADKRGYAGQVLYDSSQNPTLVRDRAGAVSQTTFGALNRPTARTDALGGTTTFGWNAAGNLTSVVNAKGDALALVPNAAGQPLSLTDFRGKQWGFSYDPLGLMQTATDPLGGQYAAAHDSGGRVTELTFPIAAVKTHATYDDAGNVLTQTDPLGHVTTFTYDDNGNLTSATFVPTAATASFTYDAGNRLTKSTDPLNHDTTYTYDVDGNLTTVTDPDGVATTYEYDKANRLTAILDPLGHRVRFTYDPNGNVSTVKNELGDTWKYFYDPKDRPVVVQDPQGAKVTTTYDALGRVSSQANQLNRTTRLAYDAVGNLTSTLLPDGGTLSAAYDAMGHATSVTDALGHSWQAAYDDAGRLASRTDPTGHAETYAYDAMGRLTQATRRDGQVVGYAYDLGGRLTTLTLPGPSTITLGYDAAGNLTTVADSSGTTSMTYDTLGRRLTRTDSYGQSLAYAYTPAGRLASITYPGSKTVAYAYDAAGRLTTVTDWLSNHTTYEYDSANRVTRVTLPNGTHQDITYDAAGRVLTRTHARSDATVIASYAYTYTAAGQIASVARSEPAAAAAASAQRAFSYDQVNRIAGATNDGVPSTYTFSPDGNIATRTAGSVTTTYTFDALDRLTSAGDGTNLTTYRYDGLGTRLAKTVNGAQTRYLREGGAVYGTFDGSGSPQLLNVYGGGLLYSLDGTGNIRVYHGDERGSVVAITDGGQNVVQAYAYDPYGRVAGSAGSLANEFGFVGLHGVLTDENGLYNMGVRYYDPDARRFVSEDPLGLAAGPNLYAYAGGDPVNRIDPSGNAPERLAGELALAAGGGHGTGWKQKGPFTDDLESPASPPLVGPDVPVKLILGTLIVANIATGGQASGFFPISRTPPLAEAPYYRNAELLNSQMQRNLAATLNSREPRTTNWGNLVQHSLNEPGTFTEGHNYNTNPQPLGKVWDRNDSRLVPTNWPRLESDEVKEEAQQVADTAKNLKNAPVPNLKNGFQTSANNAANAMAMKIMTDPQSKIWFMIGLAVLSNELIHPIETSQKAGEMLNTAGDYWGNRL